MTYDLFFIYVLVTVCRVIKYFGNIADHPANSAFRLFSVGKLSIDISGYG